ncbi:hypothetical protein B0T14DRAFT_501178 [Immersiella caudata]|uniref:Uncharacterized protein n=1 Tax=Immersiella caudata TaxID=314043 RepID=A0AA39U002_9PEZI|nr:hypothetical protein B0T14DRAFT_501178 [Immersiella caudata]
MPELSVDLHDTQPLRPIFIAEMEQWLQDKLEVNLERIHSKPHTQHGYRTPHSPSLPRKCLTGTSQPDNLTSHSTPLFKHMEQKSAAMWTVAETMMLQNRQYLVRSYNLEDDTNTAITKLYPAVIIVTRRLMPFGFPCSVLTSPWLQQHSNLLMGRRL